jgi:hypothetical protein
MKKLVLTTASTLALCGCFGEDDKKDGSAANSYIAQLVASDYSSSQVATGSISDDRTATEGYFEQDASDYRIDVYGDYVYQIGRFNIDTIARVNTKESLLLPEYEYSLAEDESASSNVYQIIQVSETKAYLIRYGKNSIQIVDPSADEENFVTGSIDLSAYTPEGNTVPTMSSGIIVDNKLFVAMQRLDTYANGGALNTPYLAVIDTSTDTEIDTQEGVDGLKGIELNASNPEYLETDGTYIYVTGRGDYASNSGALDRVAVADYSLTNIIDGTTFASTLNDDQGDDDASNNVYYHIRSIAIVDDTAFVSINLEIGYTNNETLLKTFALSTPTAFTDIAPAALSGKKISFIKAGPKRETLWVAIDDAEAPDVVVLNEDATQNGVNIEFSQPVKEIEFTSLDD